MEWINQFIMENLPALLCLVFGFGLVVIEIFTPGFGAPGILGTVLLIVGVALRAQGPLDVLVMVICIVALLCVVMSIAVTSATKGRLSRSPLVLKQELNVEPVSVGEHDLRFFVGRQGSVTSVLRPAGTAEFDGVRLNVVSEGEFIPENARVKVVEVEGNRIIVRRATGA